MSTRPELRAEGKRLHRLHLRKCANHQFFAKRLVLLCVTQGLKAVDSTIKKESDLPAADPNTPIPLKYEDRSQIAAGETGITSLLERGWERVI